MKDSVLTKISPEEALEILKNISQKDPKIAKQIEKEAERILKTVDLEDICEDVFSELDTLEVEELWDRSGSNRYGYTSPEDMSVEMMEEVLDPFEKQLLKYIDLGYSEQAKNYCMGILKGIYKFEQESNSEFKDWARDVPGECFGFILGEWKKKTKNKNDHEEMTRFIEDSCSKWSW